MGVNAAAFVRYYVRRDGEEDRSTWLPPMAGFLICLLLWLNLSATAKIAGTIWMGSGDRLRRLEDPRLPRRPGELRAAAGVAAPRVS